MQNINPDIWGPPGWRFMHYITLSYPIEPSDKNKEDIKRFFTSVGPVLPCESCRIHFNSHRHKHPITDDVLSTRDNLVIWLMNIHNEVNLIKGKPIYTLDMLYDEYMRPKETLLCDVNYTLLIMLVILIVMYLFRRYYY